MTNHSITGTWHSDAANKQYERIVEAAQSIITKKLPLNSLTEHNKKRNAIAENQT